MERRGGLLMRLVEPQIRRASPLCTFLIKNIQITAGSFCFGYRLTLPAQFNISVIPRFLNKCKDVICLKELKLGAVPSSLSTFVNLRKSAIGNDDVFGISTGEDIHTP